MESITKIWLGPLPADSPYVKPFRLYYIQNNVEKNWDLLKVHDSVSIIIFNETRKSLVLVKQFRPAVYYAAALADGATEVDLKKYPTSLGVTLELCAGIVDKSKDLVEIAQDEILEECGYRVPIERIEKVLTYKSGVGTSGSVQTMFYCSVTDDDKVTSGGGIDDELIEVIEYNLDQARELVRQGAVVCGPPSFLLGILWFLTNKVTGQ